MVATDAPMLSLMIDAFELHDVAMANVVGAYLNAKMLDFVLLHLTRNTVNTMCCMNPCYSAFITMEDGKKVLYLRLLKALYGCVQSALLWYKLFSTTLQGMGFMLNPYDPCIANKIINGKQCTIIWYMDDNKISHINANVVTQIIKAIKKYFGKMMLTEGMKHTFFGMDICFNKDRTIQIGMQTYIKNAISVFGEGVSKGVMTPAQKDIFKIDAHLSRLGTF